MNDDSITRDDLIRELLEKEQYIKELKASCNRQRHKSEEVLHAEIEKYKRLQETIAVERKRFNDVFDAIPVYLIMLTPDYHVPFANRFFTERYGESQGRRCFEYLFGLTKPCENCESYKILETMSPHEWEWIDPIGRNYHIYDYPFTDVDGSLLIMEVGIDVTGIKKAEEVMKNANIFLEARIQERTAELNAELAYRRRLENSMRITNNYLENLLNYANAPIIVWDPKYKIIRFNRAFEQLTGYNADEVLGKPLEMLFPDETKNDSMELIRRTTSGERFEVVEIAIARVDKSIRTVIWNSATLFEPDGRTVISTIAQGCDVTERKQAEEELQRSHEELELRVRMRTAELEKVNEALRAEIEDHKKTVNDLRQSEEKFSKAFHGNPIMMILATVKEGKFIDANEAFLSAIGYAREEILNNSALVADFYVDLEQQQDLTNILLKIGRFEDVEINFRTKSGEIRIGRGWSQLLYLDGKPCYLTCMLDITRQRQIERNMARLERLKLIGEMAASIGHEIRNPMTSIRGFIQLLNEKDCYDDDKVFFDLMIEELDRANSIISEYLGLARDKVVDLQPLCLDSIIKTIYPMLEADSNFRDMKIKLDLGSPPMILVDQKEIRQVIINLARNGLEAMSAGGTLTIGTTVTGSEVILFVKDEGPGLHPDILNKLGTPFKTTKENGTGLGLAVCYSIAARLNARLECETSPDGTTFKMCVPMIS